MADEPKGKTEFADAHLRGEGLMLADSATASVRVNLSLRMLIAAHGAALRAHEVETATATSSNGDRYTEIEPHVLIAVMMSAAAIEAAANEIIKDYLDRPSEFSLTAARIALLKQTFTERAGNPRQKFKQISLVLDRKPDTSAHVWNELSLLIALRNMLMHFKPRWDHEPSPDEFTTILARIGGANLFHAGPPPIFPRAAMTYGCSKWAVQTVLAFTAHYAAHLGIKDRFTGTDFSLP